MRWDVWIQYLIKDSNHPKDKFTKKVYPPSFSILGIRSWSVHSTLFQIALEGGDNTQTDISTYRFNQAGCVKTYQFSRLRLANNGQNSCELRFDVLYSLVFQPMLNQALVSTTFEEVNKKAMANYNLQDNFLICLMKLCLVLSFRYCVNVLTFWNLPKLPKHAIFGSVLAFIVLRRNHQKWLIKTKNLIHMRYSSNL